MNSDIEKSIQEQEERFQYELGLIISASHYPILMNKIGQAVVYGYKPFGVFCFHAFEHFLEDSKLREPIIHRQRLIKHLYNEVINQNK